MNRGVLVFGSRLQAFNVAFVLNNFQNFNPNINADFDNDQRFEDYSDTFAIF